MRKARVGISVFIVLLLGAGLVNADTPHPRHTPGFGDIANSLREFFRVPPKPPVAEPLALRDLPRRQLPPTGAEAKPAKRVRELEDKRTERTRQFELSDGRTEMEISAAPVNYRDAKGRLQLIDTKVKSGSGDASFTNNTNTFASSFGVGTGRLSTFDFGGRTISLGVDGPERALRPTAKGSTVRFADAFGSGADMTYDVTSGALKAGVMLAARPTSATYTFTLNLSGVTARMLPDGTIGFWDGADTDVAPLLVMPKPVMFDSKRDPKSPFGFAASTNVRQRLEGSGDRLKLVLTADEGWLNDPARAYPVTIDPTIKIQPTVSQSQDAMIVSDAPGTNYDGNWRLSVGTTASAKARSLVKFDLSSIPAGTRIDTANLQLYFSQDHTASNYDVPLEARRVTQPWTEAGVTWNNINAAMGEVAGNVVTVDDTDTAQTAINGEWPASTNSSMTQYAINGTYRFNKNSATGETFSWVPTITETGSYNVEAHYVAGPDRAIAPYTVFHAGGQQQTNVNQLNGTNGVWAGLGTHNLNAGTSHKVVLGDVADPTKAVIADAVRFTKAATVTKKVNESSVWHSYSVRSTVQSWIDGANPNHGLMLKAVDEAAMGRGGPRYEAAEYAYNGENENTPKLVVTFGKAGVDLQAPSRIYSTGAELNWTAYPGSDLLEYQVHRAVFQTYTPTAATLVAPVAPGQTTFTDTTAKPTPVDSPDPFGQVYYYMIAVKTKSGALIPAPTQIVRLPRAGRVVQILQGDAIDTTLTAGQPDTNQDVLQGKPWVYVGIGSGTYGTARTVVKFPDLSALPGGAKVLEAEFSMWSTTTIGSGATYEVHALNRDFDEKTATWNKANATTNWTTPGGDFDPAAPDIVTNNTNDPAWRMFKVPGIVQGWISNAASNHGLLVKSANESTPVERSLLLSSEGAESQLRPKLKVTYTEPIAAQTYYAPSTPSIRMIPGDQYPIPVTLNNPTGSTWRASDWVLSYRWNLPDGTDVTNGGNQLDSALPSDVAPGQAVAVNAQVKTPINSGSGNKRHEYVLRWELRNKVTGQWLSTSDGIGPLDQPVTVEDPTSDQLGLEKFYHYAGVSTGAGSGARVNLFAGNTVWNYDAFSNPSRGVTTALRMSYNSLDTSSSALGFGWSVSSSTLHRLGTPLKFHPPGQDWPTTVTLTDGDGTSHVFKLNKHNSTDPAVWDYDHPAGVHLYLQKNAAAGDPSRSWVMTKPDRTRFFFDADGYQRVVADNNNNELLFTYAERKSNNKPTKFLQYVTDPAGRRTLSIAYHAKGEAYTYFNDAGQEVAGSNLTNPHIIDTIKSVSDVDGRVLTYTYTDKGLLARMIDGFGSAQPKQFRFGYDAAQGNKNVKLVSVTDPRGSTSTLAYYDPPGDDPKFHWWTKEIKNRLTHPLTFAYVDPDGQAGSVINTTVTDAEAHATTNVIDGFGRPTKVTNAKGQKLDLTWDADNNVTKLVEDNGATTTWLYDAKTGYPLEMRDAEANANGTAPVRMAYRTGLNGYIADLETKASAEGRTWTFGYDTVGNLTSATDPAGTASPEQGDYTARYSYDATGQQLIFTDPNGNKTTSGDYDPAGSAGKVTDALGRSTLLVYDARGNLLTSTDARGKTSTFTYDLYSRPLTAKVPKDASKFIVTPAPVYDANDNVLSESAPNGATSTRTYDAADQMRTSTEPKDTTSGTQRLTSYVYDKVGNITSVTEPNGNLTASIPDDFVTRYAYDEIYQLITATDSIGAVTTQVYDRVGNLVTVVDPRKNATPDPDDFTTKYTYDLNHRLKTTTDPLGHRTSADYDKDGQVTTQTDQEGNKTFLSYDPRALIKEVKSPYINLVTGPTYRTMRYEYDQVGNRTKVVSPRGVQTTDDPDDFAQATTYDELNRVKEQILPYDREDPRYNVIDKIINSYDEVGNLTRISTPPSQGQTVRNDTTYSYFDNGWISSSTDPWGIKTAYEYNDIGRQITRSITAAGGASSRSMGWSYYPDGKLKGRTDDGVPVGQHNEVVDNSDGGFKLEGGTWETHSEGSGYEGYNYVTHPHNGDPVGRATWTASIPMDGRYELFVKYPSVPGAATNAAFSGCQYEPGSQTCFVRLNDKRVDQTQQAGQWVSIGSYEFRADQRVSIFLNPGVLPLPDGVLVADGFRITRDNTGEADPEAKSVDYAYDANGNLTTITDNSSGAIYDNYAIGYNRLNQVASVAERFGTTVRHQTTYEYNENGNQKLLTHDGKQTTTTYDPRDMVATVTNPPSGPNPAAKVTSYTYTPRGQLQRQVKANASTLDFTYYPDGRVQRQVETNGAGRLVLDHQLEYDVDGNRSVDRSLMMNADDHNIRFGQNISYGYDPRSRVQTVTKAPNGGGVPPATEVYVHDANNNVITETLNGREITYTYDRNRLVRSHGDSDEDGAYYYDPFGRLSHVDRLSVAGSATHTETKYVYDGFDRIFKQDQFGMGRVTYTYDPLDRTVRKQEDPTVGDNRDTTYEYLGLSDLAVSEVLNDSLNRTYEYGRANERLVQVAHAPDGTMQNGFYAYNPHTDVEALTDDSGNPRATYAYTAYGKEEPALFSGLDRPDPEDRWKQPYNIYRFNAKPWDALTGNVDMGFRDYSPAHSRFTTRDSYSGAAADMGLDVDPWTTNRYTYGGGNPIGSVEVDGHRDCGLFSFNLACPRRNLDTNGDGYTTPGDFTQHWWSQECRGLSGWQAQSLCGGLAPGIGMITDIYADLSPIPINQAMRCQQGSGWGCFWTGLAIAGTVLDAAGAAAPLATARSGGVKLSEEFVTQALQELANKSRGANKAATPRFASVYVSNAGRLYEGVTKGGQQIPMVLRLIMRTVAKLSNRHGACSEVACLSAAFRAEGLRGIIGGAMHTARVRSLASEAAGHGDIVSPCVDYCQPLLRRLFVRWQS